MVDTGLLLRFEPRLPDAWNGLRYRLRRHGSDLRVNVDRVGCTVEVVAGEAVPVEVDGAVVMVAKGESVRIASE
jgi:alpha,alpha-trehalose phosphorylase